MVFLNCLTTSFILIQLSINYYSATGDLTIREKAVFLHENYCNAKDHKNIDTQILLVEAHFVLIGKTQEIVDPHQGSYSMKVIPQCILKGNTTESVITVRNLGKTKCGPLNVEVNTNYLFFLRNTSDPKVFNSLSNGARSISSSAPWKHVLLLSCGIQRKLLCKPGECPAECKYNVSRKGNCISSDDVVSNAYQLLFSNKATTTPSRIPEKGESVVERAPRERPSLNGEIPQKNDRITPKPLQENGGKTTEIQQKDDGITSEKTDDYDMATNKLKKRDGLIAKTRQDIGAIRKEALQKIDEISKEALLEIGDPLLKTPQELHAIFNQTIQKIRSIHQQTRQNVFRIRRKTPLIMHKIFKKPLKKIDRTFGRMLKGIDGIFTKTSHNFGRAVMRKLKKIGKISRKSLKKLKDRNPPQPPPQPISTTTETLQKRRSTITDTTPTFRSTPADTTQIIHNTTAEIPETKSTTIEIPMENKNITTEITPEYDNMTTETPHNRDYGTTRAPRGSKFKGETNIRNKNQKIGIFTGNGQTRLNSKQCFWKNIIFIVCLMIMR